MCDFVCGTMSHAKSLLHWSVIRYQVINKCYYPTVYIRSNCLFRFRVDYLPARHQHLVPTQLHPQQALTLERSQEPAIVFLQSHSQRLDSEQDSTQQQHLLDLEVSP